MNKKFINLLLCIVLILGAAIPGTLAVSIDSDGNSTTLLVDGASGTESFVHFEGCLPPCDGEGCVCECHWLSLYERYMICQSPEEFALVASLVSEEAAAALSEDQLRAVCALGEALGAVKPEESAANDETESAPPEEVTEPEPLPQVQEPEKTSEPQLIPDADVPAAAPEQTPAEEPAAPGLYELLMAAQTEEEVAAIAGTLTEEELQKLTQEQIDAIKTHLESIFSRTEEPPVTVSFTTPGPFMPPVDVSAG